MSNPYYSDTPMVAGVVARAEDVNRELTALEVGFDRVYDAVAALETAVASLGGGTSANFDARWLVALTGGATAYVGTPNPAPSAFYDGMFYFVEPNVTNTGAVTLNINSLGAKSIVNADGSALAAGQFLSGSRYLVQYRAASGGSWQLVSQLSGVLSSRAAFSAHKNGTNQGSVADATWTKVTHGTEGFDVTGAYNTTTSTFTCAKAGKYCFVAAVDYDAIGDGKDIFSGIYKNGALANSVRGRSPGSDDTGVICVAVLSLAVNDTVNHYSRQETGSTKTINGTVSATYFMGFEV